MNEELTEAAAPGGDSEVSAEMHATRVVVWDTPPAIERGGAFRIKVGIKCALACRDEAWRLRILDHEGRPLASVRPSDAPWPGTSALYHAEVELPVPDAEGLHEWRAHVAATDGYHSEPAHGVATACFNVRVVPSPECLLKVLAVDAASEAPVKGARVVAHPYRAVTNERGVAEIAVPRGRYRLFVSGCGYVPRRSDHEVTEDLTIRAELAADLGPSDAELWS